MARYKRNADNGESFIQYIGFSPVSDLYTPVEQLVEMFQAASPKWAAVKFGALTFYFVDATIIQFGDFSIEFE